ncbi:excisionase family DNA-binding protein [Tautonia plasticadhaerens]|uniref:Helix-turn-helix domain protein n=1 Tax=Tautonia plasticadhaerens TaxID=2527974 RepID=A0A518HFI2_9BACT|nr:excisionase family DNA-binding protein [Tautonia plasticadhaerens]QDV39556.1 Helix-turn-helix domain protein [Tautonia plasticadhaerens]
MARRSPSKTPATAPAGEDDRLLAAEASRRLAAPHDRQARLQFGAAGRDAEVVDLPAAALPLLRQLLDGIAAGEPVAVVAGDDELSTQQAADLLGVSRPFLVGLLERGAMPFRKVGAHRRVRACDLDHYRRREDAERLKALGELSAQAQELGLGY